MAGVNLLVNLNLDRFLFGEFRFAAGSHPRRRNARLHLCQLAPLTDDRIGGELQADSRVANANHVAVAEFPCRFDASVINEDAAPALHVLDKHLFTFLKKTGVPAGDQQIVVEAHMRVIRTRSPANNHLVQIERVYPFFAFVNAAERHNGRGKTAHTGCPLIVRCRNQPGKEKTPFEGSAFAGQNFWQIPKIQLIPSVGMATNQLFEPGREVGAGRFAIERVLGQGGMGVVCQAHDYMLNKTVALKFLSPEIQANHAALEAMRNETRKSLDLTHPNIIRIYDFHHFADELPFISMEFIEGITLAYLKGEQPDRLFAWEAIESLMPQLCAALAYAHDVGIIHRDLKPANMMLDQNQRLRIADFGLSVTAGDPEENAEMGTSGTPCYMSPQQIVGVPSQPSDDIYALGATLYELLTSQPPFYRGDVITQVRNSPAPSMTARLIELGRENEIPTHVERLVMDCLEKDPDLRPPSIEAVAERLGAANTQSAYGIGVVSSDPSIPVPVATKRDKYKGKSAIGPVAAFCFVAIAASLFLNKLKTPPEAVPVGSIPLGTRAQSPVATLKPANLAKPLAIAPLLKAAHEIRLLKYAGRSGAGSAVNYNKYPLLAGSPRWRFVDNRLIGSVRAPNDPRHDAVAQLLFSAGDAGDFLFGVNWKSRTTNTTAPTIYYRCEATEPTSLEAADISLDGIATMPDRPEAMHFQGVLPPYRITTKARMSTGRFGAHDWAIMGEPEIADLIMKLSNSSLVRGGGSWFIIQCRGSRVRHIVNGETVAEIDLLDEAAKSKDENRRKLIEKHSTHRTTIGFELAATALSPKVEVEFGEFYFAGPSQNR